MCVITTNPYDYKYCSLGEIKVKSIDDKEELLATDDSFDVLGFSKDEKDAIYRITAGLMHSGNMEFKQKPREEQAENGNQELSDKAGYMLGISGAEYAKARFLIFSRAILIGLSIHHSDWWRERAQFLKT